MSFATNSGIEGQPGRTTLRKPPGDLALDLWRAGGSFRGFCEFALIGAIVLAFLPGGWASKLGDAARSLWSRPAPAPASGPAPELPKFSRREKAPIAPRISDVAFTSTYFSNVEEPLRSKLSLALQAYGARNNRAVEAALADADPEDRHVLLMRGLNSLSIPGLTSLQAGIGQLERAVEKGEPRAMAILGVLKLVGTPGHARNTEAGRELLERASAAGDAAAARIIAEGYLSGWIGTIDPARAERYLRLAVDRGDIIATFRLGEMLQTGHGVPKNEAEALQLFLKAAHAGHPEAQAMVGVLRLIPYSAGLTDHPDEALGWFERAAAQGEPHAMFYLGLFYTEYGKRIGRTDVVRGVDFFRRCAERTLYVECLYAYATALDLGVGTTRDPAAAYAFYSLASGLEPSPKARLKRDELVKTLTPDQIKQANMLATKVMGQARRGQPAQATDSKGEAIPGSHLAVKGQPAREKPPQVPRDAAAELQTARGVQQLIAYSSGRIGNPDEALRAFERAAAQGEPQAMLYLGAWSSLEGGSARSPDDVTRVVDLFRRCAEATFDGQCLHAYATALDLGIGVPRDPVNAYVMYALAVGYGQIPKARPRRDALRATLSTEEIDRANAIHTELKTRIPPQVRTAMELPSFKSVQRRASDVTVRNLRSAADRGGLKATYQLGEMLQVGRGIARDTVEAERLFLKAAEGGDADGQTAIGMLRFIAYSSGSIDDPNEALDWFKRAAAQGEPLAMIYLGALSTRGKLDLAAATDRLRLCAEATLNGQCLFAYATALEFSIGTTHDRAKTSAMYGLAFGRGNLAKAESKRDAAQQGLSGEEVKQAYAVATQMWRNSNVGMAEMGGGTVGSR